MDKEFTRKSSAATQDFEFNYPVVSIGSHPDNDIVLPGGHALGFHATLHLQNGQFNLVALGSASSIRIDGKVMSENPTRINEGQTVEIGSYALSFRQNGSADRVRASLMLLNSDAAAMPAGVESISQQDAENFILVSVPVSQLEVDVKHTAVYELEITNGGSLVAAFDVSLKNLPSGWEDWVEISPRAVKLNEGERARVRISITPPREPSSTAGQHVFDAVVRSSNYGGRAITKRLEMVINPYYEFSVGSLSPKDQHILWHKRTGKTQLKIMNQGNSPADFNVSVLDDENGCTFDLVVNEDTQLTRQANVTIDSGQAFTLPIQVTPHKRRLVGFSSKRYMFTTTVQLPQSGISQMTSGSASAVPLLGWWSIVMLVLLLGVGLILLLQPTIYDFRLAAGKDVIELGDTTRLEWSVSPFATNVTISGVDQPIERGQSSLTLVPGESTTYEIVASNWLSNLLRMDRKESLTVLVVPPSPRINVFEVGETSVARGKPVTVRWSVTRADQAFLTIDEVVYELPQGEFSGEQEVILEKDALVTIEAKNASGSEVRSYFVNVVEPDISVQAFTVWVRSGTASIGDPKGGFKTSKALNIPDPNFPQKFVELVPDRNSETGYRVEFYQPDRELSKGEQVIIEWDIVGTDTDKVQIAPFTDALPARGSQPFFPQESMNFVLTAKSGELEELFMLPVKVFDGTPPTAPKIEFFKASPMKWSGATGVEFAWSVSGNWTRVQLLNSDTVVADYLNPQGFRTITVSKNSTFILTAFNGELSSAAPVEIVIDPALITRELEIVKLDPSQTNYIVGEKVNVEVDFKALPVGAPATTPYPTGEITITDGISSCAFKLPAKGCELELKSAGSLAGGDPVGIIASYEGDDFYTQSNSVTVEIDVTRIKIILEPTFYNLGVAPSEQGIPLNPLSSFPRPLDSGLYIKIKVSPDSTAIPVDADGQITLKICESSSGSVQCGNTIASSPVVVDPVTRLGDATIRLLKMPKAGNLILRFEYTHAKNVIDRTTKDETGLVVNKMPIVLRLSECTNTPTPFTNCLVSVVNPAVTTLIFDIYKDNGGTLIPLTNVFAPMPDAGSFRVGSYGVTPLWSCAIDPVTDSSGVITYRLACDADLSESFSSPDSSVMVAYGFANTISPNFSMGTPTTSDYSATPFKLTVKRGTEVLLASNINGLKVGEKVVLTTASTATSGAVTLTYTDPAKNPITSTDGTITITAPATGVLGVASGSCSTPDGKTLTITQIASNCEIYFRKAGTHSLTVVFAGNATQNSDTFTTSVTIAPQDGITFTWEPATSEVAPNTNHALKILLTVPSNIFSDFLVGQRIQIALTANQSGCGLPTSVTTTLNRTIARDSSGRLYVDFVVRCVSDRTQANLKASFISSADLTTDPATSEKSILFLTPGANGPGAAQMTVEFKRVDGVDLSTNANLYMGETYDLKVTVGTLWADYYGIGGIGVPIGKYTQTQPSFLFPGELYDRIDKARSSNCTFDNVNRKVLFNLDSYTILWSSVADPTNNLSSPGASDIRITNSQPCRLVFATGASVTTFASLSTIVVRYEPTVFYWDLPYVNLSKTYNPIGLFKQDATISISPTLPGIGWVDYPVEYTVSATPLNMTQHPFRETTLETPAIDKYISFQVDDSTCLDIYDQAYDDVTKTFTLKIKPLKACSGWSIRYRYLGSIWFNATTQQLGPEINFQDRKTTTVALTTPSTSTYGQSFNLNATVSASSTVNTGAAVFKQGTTTLCTDTTVVAGAASCSVNGTALDAGAHTITVEYTSGVGEFTDGSGTGTHTVSPVTTTVALVTPSTSAYGQQFTLSATVTGSSTVNQGTVAFKQGGTTLCTDTTVVAGAASCDVSSVLSVASHTITVEYTSGSANFSNHSATGTHTVNKATPVVTLSASPTSGAYGTEVTFSVTVPKPAGTLGAAASPTGTVNYGASLPSCSSVALGTACLSTTLVPNTYSILATYSGDTNYASTPSNSVSVTISNSNTSAAIRYAGTTAKATACTTTADWSATFPFGTPTANNAVETTDYFFCVLVTDTSTPITTVGAGNVEIWVEQGGTELATTLYTVTGGTATGTRYRVPVSAGDAKFTLRFLAAIAENVNTVIYYQYLGHTGTYFNASTEQSTATFQIKP